MTLDPRRKGRITGSGVGAILGMSPWATPDDVLRRMVREYHGAPSEFNGSPATEYGTFHEKGAIQDFELEHGFTVNPSRFYMFEDWLGATPDGEIGADDLQETKCPYGLRNKPKPVPFKTADEQPHYKAQMQIEMFCAKKKRVHFWQWAPNDTAYEIVERDQSWIDENLPKLYAFYNRYLSELDNHDHLEPPRMEIETPAASKLLAEYDDLTEAIENATERRKEVLAELVDEAGGRDALVCGRKLTHVERSGSVQYAKIVKQELPGFDVEPFRGKASQYWKLS
jgi:putative phage-type endonuclease